MANTRNEGTSNRGFASMDPDEQREIASRGGRAAHASGNAHEFTSEEARRAVAAAHLPARVNATVMDALPRTSTAC